MVKSKRSSKRFKNLLFIALFFLLVLAPYTSSFAESAMYVYDDLNRLLQVDYENGTTNYAYDGSGNRISKQVSGMLSVTKSGTGSGTAISSPAGIDCGSKCSAHFADGTSVILTAAPDADFTVSWSGCDSTSGSTCTVAMAGTKSVSATFSRVSQTMTIIKSGFGYGTVTSTPAGIKCGYDGNVCSASYTYNTLVTLMATALNKFSIFTGWSGDCVGQGASCMVTMDAARSATAVFSIAETITVNQAGTGSGTVTSSPVGINCGSACSVSFAYHTGVTLTATPDSGYVTFWTGCDLVSGNTCKVTTDSNRSVTATFKPGKMLSIAKSGFGYGTVTSTPAGINCGYSCSASYDINTPVTLTATALNKYSIFTGWFGECAGQGASCTVSMDGAKSATATFGIAETLTVNKAGTGSGTVTSSPAGINCGSACSVSFAYHTGVTLTATPDSGYVTFWTGCDSATGNTCKVTTDANRSVTATFAPNL